MDECNQNISMRHDFAKIEEKEITHAHYVKTKTVQKKKKTDNQTKSMPFMYFKSDCPFKNKVCYLC